MPYLGDYLGQILSEIVMARAHVDLETIRVAELYASHPYLKHFPVPHLRLPTITLDLTYAVEHTEEIPAAGSPCGNINVEAMRKSFNAILVTKMARHHLSLNEKTRGKIDAALDDLAQTLKPPPGGAVALRSAAAATRHCGSRHRNYRRRKRQSWRYSRMSSRKRRTQTSSP